jgi:hypothetical protein
MVKMGISKVLNKLYDHVPKYQAILDKEQQRIVKKYSDSSMDVHINALKEHAISIGPMALCDSLLKDLKVPCPDKLLAGLGVVSFHISAHDDLIDETPSKKVEQGALLYSGNITLLEGINILIDNDYTYVIKPLFEMIKENDLRQQKIIEILWGEKVPTKEEYLLGISHITSFMALGPVTALAFAGRMELRERIMRFSKNYGYACQLADDMREIECDVKNSYWSLPIIRAHEKGLKGFEKSNQKKNMLISELKDMSMEYMEEAKNSIPQDWANMQGIVSKLEACIRDFEYK